ncbi:sulfite oxidase : Nitrate reductase (NADH) OS=Pedosphaera parvula (strain Ellin514) GN=Cflav_PD2911 PE=4 SV=1: Oxidored_molyb: Mo-co_dimer [Gemmataceae bacterium]|nr:sulfite oxidase : Nitrate reductase (NADH) OS=Pedosphaera parvula (strain Ellin514) GN=Cflav_PD2911 PE=4 SV=1: Oxidored_molyb: Mo-co_dimer [Gemmataceae bacterium]VTU01300.1 sulfite oxidase : Nitrate reductase (NADH) OS=Pedosphaera parvula (strain Ellin514) GN=Cflav_PD2911 PE=4 SV=1: Oxidored_molyb: Mo-co_dimer [Gemmataceae bacterium]
MTLSRRELLRTVPAAALAAGLPRFASAAGGAGGDGMIVRMQEPRNLETPLADLGGVTPTEKFFVRSHFAVPTVEAKGFTLAVEGHVEKKLELALDDLKKMATVTREVTLECAGNGRVFLVPQGRGLQWGNGGVGNAKWTGVPLGAVLERAGVKAGAVDVVLVGADKGAITSDPPSPGPIHFDRGIPLAKAKADETLLAWEMNGEPLTTAHGAPLRAVVGGWYGMAAVKWLTRVVVTDRPHAGFWQTMDYSVWDRSGASPQVVPITAIQPKAVITSPELNTVVAAGKKLTVAGVAWAGEQAVKSVELSADGGAMWAAATVEASKPLTWAKWTAEVTPAKGPLRLVARCTDAKGNAQPEKRDPDRRTYMINHLVPVDVTAK